MLLALPAFGLDTGDVLKMTASVDAIMNDAIEIGVRNKPLLSPLITPPEDWTQVRKGGLPADHWARVPLVSHHPSIEQALRKAIGTRQMHQVLDAINSLQRVPFCINEPVLDFILKAGEPPSPGPKPPSSRQKDLEKWAQAEAKLKTFHTDLVTAEAMSAAGQFWVPLNICFRGRVYGIPHFNFAREDHVRALFLFANGERIGEDGLMWLKSHVAATANGNSRSPEEKPGRLGFKDRIAWTDSNISTLRHVGEAALRRDDPAKLAWALPGDPYQFVAACIELVQALDKGPEFITRLPLTFDGSCSGLQHLCAMTRAEEGRFVNLVPSEEGDDFYSRVAFRVSRRVPDLMNDPFDREIVKQPAMSYFYGAEAGGFTQKKRSGKPIGPWRSYGMTRQIIDVLKQRKKAQMVRRYLLRRFTELLRTWCPRRRPFGTH